MLQEIQSEMRWAHHKGVKFISADEAVFTFHTFTKKSWSGSYNNITVLDRKITVKTHAILAGISEDKGLEHYLVCLKSIKTEEYIQFLEKIAEMYPHQKIVLFVDNLIVHKTKLAKEAYERLKITPLFNVPYSPQFNGIEFYWSLVKQHYKKLLLYHLMHDLPVDCMDLISSSIKRVSDKKAMICAKEGRLRVERQMKEIVK